MLSIEGLFNDIQSTWEISQYRDDRQQLIEWFNYCQRYQIGMVGFNNVGYDYPMCHFIYTNPNCTVQQIYEKNNQIISGDRFANTIWPRDRFAPQIDLFKIHHFDNMAKTTTLKALQVNMRSPTVVESRIPFGVPVQAQDVDGEVLPYNRHDIKETKRFAHYSLKAIEFRLGLIDQFGIDVLNFNDTKIGEKMLEQRLGDDVCYDRSSGRKQMRQTPRSRIALNDIIFPYVQFTNPEFQRVLDFMKAQTLTPEDLEDPEAPIKTKGVFTGLTARVGGLDFVYGTGGCHASVERQKFAAGQGWIIRDIDVEGLYPNIAIKNKLAPEHLGEHFTSKYAEIPDERKLYKKGTYMNAALKLAANGAWGKSNSKYSVFFDPKYAMTIPINGQLMISMLAEWLLTVPTLSLIQANTDGITYMIREEHEPQAVQICKQWEAYTCLKLEDANYSRMWIRDVNNYVAEDTKGKLKQKGAYWHPDPMNYADSISQSSPPCWYKDLGNIVSIRAAIAAMVHGVDPATFIRAHTDPFDFMNRIKVDRSSRLMLGGVQIQSTTRYYVAREGSAMVKVSPPPVGAVLGDYKRRNGLKDIDYQRIAATVPAGTHDERIHTKNKSRYELRETAVEAGWLVAECNDARSFRFDNLNYQWYLAEAQKLIIG
jgi:hypothetical protein